MRLQFPLQQTDGPWQALPEAMQQTLPPSGPSQRVDSGSDEQQSLSVVQAWPAGNAVPQLLVPEAQAPLLQCKPEQHSSS